MSAGPITWMGGAVAVVLAAVTFVYLGPSADAAAWACVQVVLVALAVWDIQTRRLPNFLTLPTAAAALVLRAVFARSDLVEVVVAGAAAFAVFYVIALVARGGLGLGDVKLAGMLGCLLGSAAVQALALGIFVGGIWAIGLVLSRRATRRSAIAYGQFLAFGGAVAILFADPPRLV